MSASSASTITCSALLFSFSPTANCKGRSWLARFYHGSAGQPKEAHAGVAGHHPITQSTGRRRSISEASMVVCSARAAELTAMLDAKGVAYDKTQLLA
jgi:hypothetical protein